MDLSTEGCDKDHCAKMMMKLNKMRENNEHCDFTVKVDGKEIPAHRNILSAGSDYFHAMLSHENVESSSGVVYMKQVEFSPVKSCINFIYTGQLSLPGRENRKELMHTAHIMQLQSMCDEIAVSLEEELNPGAFYSTKVIATTYNCARLVECCNKFALKNFQAIVVQDDFKYLEKDFISFLVGSKETKTTADVKCKALIIWTRFDTESRRVSFEELFGKLDLGKVTLAYQRHLLENEALVSDSISCLRAIALLPFKRNSVKAKDINLQAKQSTANAIAVFDKTSKSIQAFDPEMKTWTKMQAISDQFIENGFTAVVIDDMIYVLVFDGSNYQLHYTDTNATWLRLTDRSLTKSDIAAIAFEGSIHAFHDSKTSSKTVEKFDPSDETWSHVTDKPVEGCGTSVVTAEGSIYCIGGYNGRRISDAVKFNPSDSTWTTLPSMPTARSSAAAVDLDGKIYVIGGYNNNYLNIVECFDKVAETWTTVARLKTARGGFKSCVVDGRPFVVGGFNSSTIEELDPAVNKWKVVETMNGKDIQQWASISLNVSF